MKAIEMLAEAEGDARSTVMYGSATRLVVAYPAGSGVGERLAAIWDGSGPEPRLRPWHRVALALRTGA